MNEMLEDLNSQPSAAEGFSAATFYKGQSSKSRI
jgi:hypothetical protein